MRTSRSGSLEKSRETPHRKGNPGKQRVLERAGIALRSSEATPCGVQVIHKACLRRSADRRVIQIHATETESRLGDWLLDFGRALIHTPHLSRAGGRE